jgi:hypothetical protein
VTASVPIDSRIRHILTQNASELDLQSYTQDQFVRLLAKLAAATWNEQDNVSVSIDPETAVASISLGEKETEFPHLCVDCGLLVQDDAGKLRFCDVWTHGYFAAHALVHLLGDEYSDRGLTRDNAARALEGIGSPAIPVLIAVLAAEDDAMGLGASVVLRHMGATAIPALIEAIAFGNRRVRRWATSALSSKENANAALPMLLQIVENDDGPLVVCQAIVALRESKNPAAEPALIAALRHSHPLVQMLSKQALEEFDSPRARRALDDLVRPAPGSASHPGPSRESRSSEQTRHDERVTDTSSPRIFISYAKEDVCYADELRRLLKLADFDPWMDSAGLLAGDAWEARLLEIMRTSDFVVALLSEHTAGGYQEEELRVALENAPAGRPANVPFVLSLLLRGDSEAALPGFLDRSKFIRVYSFDTNWRLVHEWLSRSARSAGLSTPLMFRSEPRTDLDESAASEMIVKRNFFDGSRNIDGRPAAEALITLLNGALVEDRATGRIWTRNCAAAMPYLGQTHARMVAWKANEQRLGGSGDWRLPTLEEAMSLMTREKNARGLFISPYFSDDDYVLTCDTCMIGARSFVWVVCYGLGDCQVVPTDAEVPVRLVRTDWEYLE